MHICMKVAYLNISDRLVLAFVSHLFFSEVIFCGLEIGTQ